MRKSVFLAVLLSLCFAAVGSAQVIYAPVQSQYRTQNGTYYYGGSDPRAHQYAADKLDCSYTGRSIASYAQGWGYLPRSLITPPRYYTISDRAIYLNSSIYGYTPTDARNEAYARVPTFFRMSDLLKSATVAADGVGYVVPAQAAGTVDIRPSAPRRLPPATGPASNPAEPNAILIIPAKRGPREL